MADMSQAQARSAAIAAGHSPDEVDAFIAAQGGARTSAQRITSAFGVAGSVGTNDLTAFHAQKATAAGQDASGKGTYLSGMPGSVQALGGGGGGGAGGVGGDPGTVPDAPPPSGSAGTPSVAALSAVTGSDSSSQLLGRAMGNLRGLGQRMIPQSSNALASLGRRVY